MKKTLILAFLSTLASAALPAQTISLEFPAHPEACFSLTLKYGTALDTVVAAKLDSKGCAQIVADPEWKNYRGMAKISIENNGSFDFVMAGENNPHIICKAEYPHAGNTSVENSPENQFLQSGFVSQYLRRTKLELLGEAAQVYSSEDNLKLSKAEEKENFRSVLFAELERLHARQHDFERELTESPLYAARFIRYYNRLHNEIEGLSLADSSKKARMRNFVRDSLDVNGLFNSGLWFDTLNGLLALYGNNSPYHQYFIDDMALLLARAESGRTYGALAENVFEICETLGWNSLEEQLAYRLINDGRIQNPSERLKMLLTLFKLSKGEQAPALTQLGAKNFEGKTLLVFYDSDCGACQNEIRQLKDKHQTIVNRGYKIVSVAADADPRTFAGTAQDFPWDNKLCDLKGMAGDDFKNYGVIGTPVFYLIDENGAVQGRHARLEDTGLLEL
ncbi:MAG: redoxin domain-containing protein [Prevotellaceae bacterium]|jgi:hypothetical protein|nr:redoxin domain-containing protein [Prevotellaceae bacterium]